MRAEYKELSESSETNQNKLYKQYCNFIENSLGGEINDRMGNGSHFPVYIPHHSNPKRVIPGHTYNLKKDSPPLWKRLMEFPISLALDLEPKYRVPGIHAPAAAAATEE